MIMGKYRSKSTLYSVINTRAERSRKRTQGDRQPQVIRNPWRAKHPRQVKPQGDQQPDGDQVEAHED